MIFHLLNLLKGVVALEIQVQRTSYATFADIAISSN